MSFKYLQRDLKVVSHTLQAATAAQPDILHPTPYPALLYTLSYSQIVAILQKA